ncbi:MAG: hypothetical protein K6T90_17750 [Leptolyngbyaceae cyanobacterium HOT.MB2.61]|nr:hypothetical protein [Leptolyngbyaceae cyanobacterium HOT.MB2.61]
MVAAGHSLIILQRQSFEFPIADATVEEISSDGGKARIRAPKGEICRWQGYKAVNLYEHTCEAFFQEN